MPSTNSKRISLSFLAIIPLAAGQTSCGGGGAFQVSDIRANLPGVVFSPRSVLIRQQNTGQVCIVNRAPATTVNLSSKDINDAIQIVLNSCCAGGQNKITAVTRNVIDLSVQALGQNCTP